MCERFYYPPLPLSDLVRGQIYWILKELKVIIIKSIFSSATTLHLSMGDASHSPASPPPPPRDGLHFLQTLFFDSLLLICTYFVDRS